MANDLRLHLADQVVTDMVDDLLALSPARQIDAARGEDILILLEMTERYGLDTVHAWLRNLAAPQGRSLCK